MREHHFELSSIQFTHDAVGSYDRVLLATDHDKFDYELIKASAKLIGDLRGRYLASVNHIVKA